MKKRQRIKTKVGLGLLLVAALALAMVPTGAKAQEDSDLDGFTDEQEINGILLFDGTRVYTDYLTPDLFVILVSATDLNLNVQSNFPPNPLEFVHMPQAGGGRGIVIHEIPYDEANPERYVSPNYPQKAVRITENLHPEGIILGYANQGTPNDLDDAIIYTEHIKSHVYSVCAGTDTCVDSKTGLSGQDLINLYIKHTIAHEIGHMTRLAVDYNSRFGGYHYKSGSEVVMEQAVKYTSKKGGKEVKFYISTDYADPSQEGLRLK